MGAPKRHFDGSVSGVMPVPSYNATRSLSCLVPNHSSATSRAIDALAGARSALSSNRPEHARAVAQYQLAEAVRVRDRYLEAHACLVFAEALSAESKFGWARRVGQHAELLFRRCGDVAGCLMARCVLAYCESALGRDEAATRIAADAVNAASETQSRVLQAAALNYSGVAAFWSGSLGTARGLLDGAGFIAGARHKPSAASFQPLTNSCFAEVLRLVESEARGDRKPDTTELARTIRAAEQALHAGSAGLSAASPTLGLVLLALVKCIDACTSREHAGAEHAYQACKKFAMELPRTSWGHAIVAWAQAEVAAAAREYAFAIDSVAAMRHIALRCNHRQFSQLAKRVGARIQSRAARDA
jgi:hypothetical protein